MHVRLSQKGWLVIPAALREKYGLKPGMLLQVIDYGGVLSILPVVKDPIQEGAGILNDPQSLTDEIITEHRLELQRESG